MLKQLVILSFGLFIHSLSALEIKATNDKVQYEGRIIKDYSNGEVKFNWPGSYFKTRLIGKSISMVAKGIDDQFDVLVNGDFHKKIKILDTDKSQEYVLYESIELEDVIIEVVKRTENYHAFTAIESFQVVGRIEGVWQQQKHILFIGDSISAGFASESTQRDCSWDEVVNTSNARIAFPYITASQLNATHTQVSYSGLGLIRNWGGNQPHHDLPYYADKAGALFAENTAFEDTFPDLIIIEVGTNDFSTDPKDSEPWSDIQEVKAAWIEKMVTFVETLKNRYPEKPFVIMPRPAYPYDLIIPSTKQAILKLNELGYDDVFSHVFDSQLNACIWHPTEHEHKEIATKLVKFINGKGIL